MLILPMALFVNQKGVRPKPKADHKTGTPSHYSGDSGEYLDALSPDAAIPPPHHALKFLIWVAAVAILVATVSRPAAW